jgi:hypothetical protein
MNLCLHCEARPQETLYRLCKRCASRRTIKMLYQYTKRLTPAWDRHLQELVERAKRRLPLFPEPPVLADSKDPNDSVTPFPVP